MGSLRSQRSAVGVSELGVAEKPVTMQATAQPLELTGEVGPGLLMCIRDRRDVLLRITDEAAQLGQEGSYACRSDETIGRGGSAP